MGVTRVGIVLGWDEEFDASRDGGIDNPWLIAYGRNCYWWDQSVLPFQNLEERQLRAVAGLLESDTSWKLLGVSRVAREKRNLVAGLVEF